MIRSRVLRTAIAQVISLISVAGTSMAQGSSSVEEVLTNQAVVDMVVGKVPKELILAKIKGTRSNFDLTAAGLVSLNASKVPKDIIKAMMDVAMPAPPSPAPAPPPPAPPTSGSVSTVDGAPASSPVPKGQPKTVAPAPATPAPARRAPRPAPSLSRIPTDPGIYIYADEGHGADFLPLEPTVYTSGKTSGALGSALTGGIAKAKLKAVVRGAEASIRTIDPAAEFYFVFDQKSASLSNSNAWGGAALTSPNEFQLVRLEVKESTREVVVGAMNAFGAQSGTEDKANIAFVSTRLKPGVYRVMPSTLLAAGQYAFFSVGGGPPTAMGAQVAQKLFDFGVVP